MTDTGTAPSTTRERASAVLIAVGFAFAVLAGPLLYSSSVIDDADVFVALTDRVIDHPDVRDALAENVSDLVVQTLQNDDTLDDILPGDARALAVPFAIASATEWTDAAYDVVDTDTSHQLRTAALRELHDQVVDVETTGITIDLRSVLVHGAREVGGPTIGSAVARIVSGTEAGQYVVAVDGSSAERLIDASRRLPAAGPAVVIAMTAVFAAAIGIAADRRRAVVRAGLATATGFLLASLIVTVLAQLGLGAIDTDAPGVGRAIAEVVSTDFAGFQRGPLLIGLGVAVAGVLLGSRRAAVGTRQLPHDMATRSRRTPNTIAMILGDNPAAARVTVWAAAVVTFLGWNNPTTRVVWTVAGLALAAHLIVWMFTSSSAVSAGWRRNHGITAQPAAAPETWLRPLRVAVIVVAAAVVLGTPSLDVRGVVVRLLLLAVIEIALELPAAWRGAKPARPVQVESSARLGRSAPVAAAAVVVVALVAGLLITSRSTDRVQAAEGCNGHVELCDRPIDELVFAGSHNAMASRELGWALAAQESDIIGQLDAGVRALLVDTHYWDLTGSVEGADLPAVEAVLVEELADAAPRPGLWLCNGYCDLGSTELYSALVDIRVWLESNPREVIVLLIQDEVNFDGTMTADTMTAFTESGLLSTVHNHVPGTPWPTLEKLIDADERVLVFAENGGSADSWYQNEFESAFTTTSSRFSAPEEFTCVTDRGSSDNDLLLANHWLTTGVPDRVTAATANDRDVLLARVAGCENERGRRPNVIAVDFAETGDLFQVIDELNGVAP